MEAGDLNRRIQLLEQSSVINAYGERVGTWTNRATLWANIRQLSGVETIRQGIELPKVSLSARIRFRRDVKPSMRLKIAGQLYDIKAVLPDLTQQCYVDLVCEAIHGTNL